ncbi:MAG TPA: CpsB/CapC family capsule biosynthesis tyrosine phosphatase [Gaiellaceae bacterium]|jgi:protein-tyrosine phosphatase|nr:CpsB/CapC family capsule biosynthesis tyrosine phosphatase [Gaiellaceae bacterium]
MAPDWFVDVHSHVVPSGDDGAQSMAEGAALCLAAAEHGTRTLFATPHVAAHLPPDEAREEVVSERVEELRRRTGVDVRLGWELTPIAALLDLDPRRYALEGLDVVLMEVPFTGSADLLLALAEHVEAAGLTPLIAHPERTEAVLRRPALAVDLAERGWPLQVNSTSLLGRHGPERQELGWWLLRDGLAQVVASDGHRETRPARLDDAYELALAELGPRARFLFDGSALEVPKSRRPASRAASRGA